MNSIGCILSAERVKTPLMIDSTDLKDCVQDFGLPHLFIQLLSGLWPYLYDINNNNSIIASYD